MRSPHSRTVMSVLGTEDLQFDTTIFRCAEEDLRFDTTIFRCVEEDLQFDTFAYSIKQ